MPAVLATLQARPEAIATQEKMATQKWRPKENNSGA
jgi:hypothetical protein